MVPRRERVYSVCTGNTKRGLAICDLSPPTAPVPTLVLTSAAKNFDQTRMEIGRRHE